MTSPVLANFDADAPPSSLDPPLQALWWLRKGGLRTGPEWERAHEISQAREGDKDHDWVHALVHLIEGDTGNAAYWFRRAGEARACDSLEDEWQHIFEQLTSR